MRIGIDHKALFAANSLAIGKKSNAVDYPSPRQRKPQGVLQRFLNGRKKQSNEVNQPGER